MERLGFRDRDADLAAIEGACLELTAKGLTPRQAQVEVVSQMAMQALQQGADQKEVLDALFYLSNVRSAQSDQPNPEKRIKSVMTEEQLEELHCKMNALRDLLIYWDVILSAEIQRYAFRALEQIKEKNLYKFNLKQYANKLIEEARKVQIRIKDNDKTMVEKWCQQIDKRMAFVNQYCHDGGGIVSKFNVAYQEVFKKEWDVIWKDCGTVSESADTKYPDIVRTLLALDALTNTGVEMYDTCVKKMKSMMTGKGTFNIRKSTHHESMRNAVNNLRSRLMTSKIDRSEVQARKARENLSTMQSKMIKKGLEGFFQDQFDLLTEEFTHYILAGIRMEIAAGRVRIASIRTLYYRLGTRHRVEKILRQLSAIPMPDGEYDVWDVVETIPTEQDNSEITRFRNMCKKNERHEQPESQAKTEARSLRQHARKNGGVLPDDVLRVMVMYYKTKKALVEHLETLGFELRPTLRRVRKMKASELKQL